MKHVSGFESFDKITEEKGEKWIAGAIKRPGALRKKLGKKGGEKISKAEIKKEMDKLKAKDKDPKKSGIQGLSKRDLTKLRQLNLAKTLKKIKESHDYDNYMFFGNLENMKRMIDEIMELDPEMIDQKLTDGHDWASDHVSVASENLEHVYNFFINQDEEELDDKDDHQDDENEYQYGEEDVQDVEDEEEFEVDEDEDEEEGVCGRCYSKPCRCDSTPKAENERLISGFNRFVMNEMKKIDGGTIIEPNDVVKMMPGNFYANLTKLESSIRYVRADKAQVELNIKESQQASVKSGDKTDKTNILMLVKFNESVRSTYTTIDEMTTSQAFDSFMTECGLYAMYAKNENAKGLVTNAIKFLTSIPKKSPIIGEKYKLFANNLTLLANKGKALNSRLDGSKEMNKVIQNVITNPETATTDQQQSKPTEGPNANPGETCPDGLCY